MRKNEISNWYKNKHRSQDIPQYEMERKWRMYLWEQEQMALAENASLKGLSSYSPIGGNLEPAPIPIPVIILPLLDLYPSAAVAYSLRKLSSTYMGPAIRIRRSSDNNEQDIGFDLDGNLDVTDLTSFCGSSSGFVTIWYDQSGNTKNVTMPTAVRQPQIVNSGVIITTNSKPTISFTNQYLQTTSSVLSTDFAVSGVGNTRSDSTNAVLFTQYTFFGPDRTIFYMGTNSTRIMGVQIGTTSAKTGTPSFSQKLFYYDRSGSDINYADDNTNLINFTNSTLIANTPLRFGIFFNRFSSPFFLNQNIQECVVYTTSQLSNREGIKNNTNTYYNIF
jgi:hypothetical protein